MIARFQRLIIRLLWPAAVLGGACTAPGATKLSLVESSGAAGTSMTLPLSLETTDQIAAIQLDIAKTTGVTLGDLTLGSAGGPAHLLDTEPVSNSLRAVIFSATNTALGSGTLLEIPLTLGPAVPASQRAISLENVMVASTSGNTLIAQLLPFGRLTAPTAGPLTPESAASTFQVSAVAIDTGGDINLVEFKANGQTIGISTTAPYAVAWQPTSAGAYVITALITDKQGNETAIGGTGVTVEFQNSYNTWAAHFFGADAGNPQVAGLLQDPDHNGLANIFSYALGLNPRAGGSEHLPATTTVEAGGQTYGALVFRVPADLQGVTFLAEYSADLLTWRSGPDYTVTETVSEGLYQKVTVRSKVPLAQERHVYFKLKVELE
jgi:hypothetical protein